MKTESDTALTTANIMHGPVKKILDMNSGIK